jgi:hypothetical protein
MTERWTKHDTGKDQPLISCDFCGRDQWESSAWYSERDGGLFACEKCAADLVHRRTVEMLYSDDEAGAATLLEIRQRLIAEYGTELYEMARQNCRGEEGER